MRMRAAMTYGFGRLNSRGTTPWHLTENGEWRGNPSISQQVSRYMVSLRRRKVRTRLWLCRVNDPFALGPRRGGGDELQSCQP
jgi:hypothetical protein